MDKYNFEPSLSNVICDSSLSTVDKMVYVVLYSQADNVTRQCSPKVALIAANASCSEGTVRKSLATLEKRGVIRRKFRYVCHRQISSLYTVISGDADYYSGDSIPSENNLLENNSIVEVETDTPLSYPNNEKVSSSTMFGHTCSIGDTENMGNTKMMARVHQDEGVKKILRIFNNSLKGEAYLPASAEKESSPKTLEEPTSSEETKNSLMGEALLPSFQLHESEKRQEKPQATGDNQDSPVKTLFVKAETHIAEEMRACLLTPTESAPRIPEQKALTQEEKMRRYEELRRQCEERHREEELRRKAEEAEKETSLNVSAEKEAIPEESKTSQESESTLPDYLIQQYEEKRKYYEEMAKPMGEPKDTSVEMRKVLDEIKNRAAIKAESDEVPVIESKLTDKTPIAKTEPIVVDNSPMASRERLEHQDPPMSNPQAMKTGNIPVPEDRHMKADNALKPAEASKPPVARDEPLVPKETDKPAKGKYSGGGSSKDVYPIDYAPDIMRPTAEYFLLKTGRKGLRWEEVSVLRKLSATQYPTRVNKEIERACERFKKRNQSLLCLTLMYIWAALKDQPTWGRKAKKKAETQPEVVKKPMTEEEKEAIQAEIDRLQAKFDEEERLICMRG